MFDILSGALRVEVEGDEGRNFSNLNPRRKTLNNLMMIVRAKERREVGTEYWTFTLCAHGTGRGESLPSRAALPDAAPLLPLSKLER